MSQDKPEDIKRLGELVKEYARDCVAPAQHILTKQTELEKLLETHWSERKGDTDEVEKRLRKEIATLKRFVRNQLPHIQQRLVYEIKRSPVADPRVWFSVHFCFLGGDTLNVAIRARFDDMYADGCFDDYKKLFEAYDRLNRAWEKEESFRALPEEYRGFQDEWGSCDGLEIEEMLIRGMITRAVTLEQMLWLVRRGVAAVDLDGPPRGFDELAFLEVEDLLLRMQQLLTSQDTIIKD